MLFLSLISTFFSLWLGVQAPANPTETDLVGVYKGTALFIQNPFLSEQQQFCITDVFLNGNRLDLNYKLSAIKVDFEGQDMYTPVALRLVSRDSLCAPVIINPDAIFFHTSFRFTQASLTDSLLQWSSQGENARGQYVIEKLEDSFWEELENVESQANFESANYEYEPKLEEGPNKYRIRYDFGNGTYLYSDEMDFDYYPEPVTFTPKSSRKMIYFSRVSNYEVYDPKSNLVLKGTGSELDISALYPGDYVIYFDGKTPSVFTKQR